MRHLAQDLRFAVRSFRRAPVFTAVAILSLALGIGANTAIFTLIDQLILRLLPIQDPARVVILAGRGRHYGGNNGRNALAYPMYQDLRDRNPVFSGMMCRYRLSPTVTIGAHSEVIGGELVSGNYFPLLGIRPAIGRLFTAGDDLHAGEHPYAVLSYAFWQARFAGDPQIPGQTIRVNNYPVTIVGVSQRGFDGLEPGLPAGIFVPMAMAAAVRPGFTEMFDRRQRWVNVYGRLKPGVGMEQAKAGLQPLFHQIIEMEVRQPAFRNATSYDKEQFLRMWLNVMPGSQGNTNLRRQYQTPLLVLMAVVGLVLLIACANMAGLLTARAAARQKEIAIRLAMGSSRGLMIQQLLTESVLLAAAGGAAGIGLAMVMAKGLLGFLPTALTGYNIRSTPDLPMLAFTSGLALVTGIAFGLVPALQSTRPDIAPTLKDQAGNIMGGAQVGFRKALVASQVALSLLLLIGAGLFIRSLANLRSIDPGFQTANLIQFAVSPRSIGYTSAQTQEFYKRLRQRLETLPGVRAAGLSQMTALNGNEWDNSVTIEGYQPKRGEDIDPHRNDVTGGYFDAVGMHILAGRDFSVRDDLGAPPVAIVNARFARRYFADGAAVGHRIGFGSDPGTPTNIEIVGVVNDTRYESLRDEIPLEVYTCSAQRSFIDQRTAYVRTLHDPESAFAAIRATVHELDANLPILNLKTVDRQLDESLINERLIATLSSVFGALATALAILGLYGVMSYMVTRRSREIGIRMALGAGSRSVLWLVMQEVLVLVVAGIVVGLPAAYGLTRVVQSQLYEIAGSTDLVTMGLSSLLLAGVALFAGFVPARRAASYDPVRVLRYE